MKTQAQLARKCALLALLGVALLEAGLQLSGLLDFPLYQADNSLGYFLAPNQSGAFLHAHHFRFNEYSMGAGPFHPDHTKFNLLLVGDSIVLGGNPLDEPERLGPSLEAITGWGVWPASAGSWSLQNELAYLGRYPAVVDAVDAVAIVSNSGDFDEPSSWASELTHPTHRPFPALVYLFRKYIAPGEPPPVRPELQVAKRDWKADLQAFAGHAKKPILIFLYPDREEAGNPGIAAKRLYSRETDLRSAIAGAGDVFRVSDAPEWNTSLYRDVIHPSGAGDKVLANIISRAVDAYRHQQKKMLRARHQSIPRRGATKAIMHDSELGSSSPSDPQ